MQLLPSADADVGLDSAKRKLLTPTVDFSIPCLCRGGQWQSSFRQAPGFLIGASS
jgi:hypothetical protein